MRTVLIPKALFLCLFLAASGVSNTHGQGKQSDLNVSLAAQKVVVADGKESLVPADKAKPGDVIEYKALYQNRGKTALHDLAATVPIPAGLSLVENSPQPTAQLGSVDGKNFQALPLKKKVKNAAGVAEEQPVPLGEYRALRWTVTELAPGSEATVSLRARVLTNTGAH